MYDTRWKSYFGKSSTWCLNPVAYDEMKGIENLWVQHQVEFLLLLFRLY